jgi:hypothetical protein
MSTPSGKPPSPIDLSAYVSLKARERAATERHSSEHGNDQLRSPYAPKGAHERPTAERQSVDAAERQSLDAAERHSIATDRDPLRSPYAPAKARAEPAIAPDFSVSPTAERQAIERDESRLCPDDLPAVARAPASPLADEHDDYSPSTAFEQVAAELPVDLDEAASLQPAHANHGQHERPAAQHQQEIMGDTDLDRLEASLRWLQRQEAAVRRPLAPLPPKPGFASFDAGGTRGPSGYRHSAEMSGNAFRSPRSLEPERLRPPPLRSRRDSLRWPLRILIASISATPILYYFAVGSWAPPSEPAPPPQLASVEPVNVAPPPSSVQQRWPTRAQDDDRGTLAPSEIPAERTKASPPEKPPASESVAMLQPREPALAPREPAPQAPPPVKAVRTLDPEQIKLLVKQGEQFIAAGDLVTARTVFQRAAEAGDAAAAMALAATYDPTVLARLGVVGMSADVVQARTWYQKAESLGAPEARRRLEVLANR